jgi:hypothetical protein
MKWAGHIAAMGEMRNAGNVSVRKPEWANHFENLDVYGSIMLTWM